MTSQVENIQNVETVLEVEPVRAVRDKLASANAKHRENLRLLRAAQTDHPSGSAQSYPMSKAHYSALKVRSLLIELAFVRGKRFDSVELKTYARGVCTDDREWKQRQAINMARISLGHPGRLGWQDSTAKPSAEEKQFDEWITNTSASK